MKVINYFSYPRSSGAPALQPLPENVLTLGQAGHRRGRLYLVNETITPV